jgi:pyruvate dehydrogenase E2 component (dihydrolipoamide acetyltransferase)
MASLVDIKVPDLGDFHDVDVIEVMVKPGDRVAAEQSLITLESEKATMEVPSPRAGIVREVKLKLGDKVSEGAVIAIIDADEGAIAQPAPPPPESVETSREPKRATIAKAAPKVAAAVAPALAPKQPSAPETLAPAAPAQKPHASPAVRKFARELGVEISQVAGSGPHLRIFRADVMAFVSGAMKSRGAAGQSAKSGAGLDLIPWPTVDFAKFGPVETRAMSRIRRATKANLARNWLMIPHVTQFDDADITELEEFRREINDAHAHEGVKVTLLALILKGLVAALSEFPDFNASLDGDNLILKKYFHFGFAADTPNGLIVPVVRDVDKKGIIEIARETADLAARARAGKLGMTEMQGGCFTVSSLGGIGGTAFTPIINAPEVAILGVSRSVRRPVYHGDALLPRIILPLSLSYDHRVIDGAYAARFITYLGGVFADMRRALL